MKVRKIVDASLHDKRTEFRMAEKAEYEVNRIVAENTELHGCIDNMVLRLEKAEAEVKRLRDCAAKPGKERTIRVELPTADNGWCVYVTAPWTDEVGEERMGSLLKGVLDTMVATMKAESIKELRADGLAAISNSDET